MSSNTIQDPFMTGLNPITGGPIGAVDVASRIKMVQAFNRNQCMQAMQLPDLQETVRAAVARRLRHLERAGQVARSGTG